MFTGIIQGQGEIVSAIPAASGRESRLAIRPLFAIENIVDGESIAVNGVCLTVEKHENGHAGACFTAYASAETLSHTTLGSLRAGSLVNLERALAVGDRLGGHIVSGHVDCVASLQSIEQAGLSRRCRVVFAAGHGPEIIERGSVTLDGISLTVTRCGNDWLEVNIIPETQNRTTMSQWRPGSRINLETDIIGKYVRRATSLARDSGGGITRDFLLQHGFMS